MMRAMLMAAWLMAGLPQLSAHELHVSPQGKDSWSGRLPSANAAGTDGPFATLERARDEVRAARKSRTAAGPVTVVLHGGVCYLPAGFKLGREDSGTADSPVVWRAAPGETPVLVGGRPITGFRPYKGAILQADVAAQGFRGAAFRQLLCDGERQHLARYPNFDPANPYGGGWAYADGKDLPMYQDVPGESRRTLHYKEQDARSWARPDEGEVFVFPRYNWWNNIVRIASLDRDQRILTLTADASYPIRPGDRYFVQGCLEELDAPGEWYLDSRTGTLYFWPPAPLAGRTVYAPTALNIVEIGPGAEHISLRGLTLQGCEGTAVVLTRTTACRVAGCTVRNVGNYHGSGVSVSGGRDNAVIGCDISGTGSHGVALFGGDRKTLTPANNRADNNYIHHVGVFYKQGVGVMLDGVGNAATHNLIHDGPRMGVMFSGNNLLIEYNHIRHMNLETEDTGAVYTGGRDWISSRGTVIRHNYFHDMLGYGRVNGKWVSPHFAWGVYLDDNAGGVDVVGNIVARCPRAGLHLHNGRDNLIENNVFLDSRLQQVEYSGWTDKHPYWTSHLPTMIQGYELVAGQPAWKGMRNMDVHPTKAVLPDGKVMTGNRFVRNVVSYADPKAKLFQLGNVPLDRNEWEDNLYWHHGQPLLTGQRKVGRALSANLAPNPGFEEGPPGTLPQDWQWQIRPRPDAFAGAVADDTPGRSGQRVLRMDAALATDKPRDNYPIVVSKEFPAETGQTYRLRARLKASRPGARASLMLQSYRAGEYFWANWPNEVKVGPAWQDAEFVFKVPGPGERGSHEGMKSFRARVDFPDAAGSLFVDDVVLERVAMLDEWAAWQALGLDRRSLVADPLFVDPARGDYRLRPESPAFQLGFKPIPVEKIGPYRDELRASWPIVEAAGAREHPLSP